MFAVFNKSLVKFAEFNTSTAVCKLTHVELQQSGREV